MTVALQVKCHGLLTLCVPAWSAQLLSMLVFNPTIHPALQVKDVTKHEGYHMAPYCPPFDNPANRTCCGSPLEVCMDPN